MAVHVPRRRCVGCGRVASKPELVRLALRPVVSPDSRARPVVVLDAAGRMGGRGAYVCRMEQDAAPTRECIARASARGVLERAFRSAVSIPTEFVESESR